MDRHGLEAGKSPFEQDALAAINGPPYVIFALKFYIFMLGLVLILYQIVSHEDLFFCLGRNNVCGFFKGPGTVF